jgi:predicted ester cyclase
MSALDNKALIRRWVEALNNGTWAEAADALFTTTFVVHDPMAGPRLAAGPQGMKDFQAPYFAAFPDVQFTMEDQIAEGDKVMTRWTARGTHRGPPAESLPRASMAWAPGSGSCPGTPL